MRYGRDKLYVMVGGSASVDTNGDPVIVQPTETFVCYCRYENNTAGRKVTSGGGEVQTLDYSFIVYMPLNCADIAQMAEVRVKDAKSSKIKVSGNVLRFARERFNCRLWV